MEPGCGWPTRADEVIEQPLAGDPYRPVADDRAVLAAQEARVAEVGTVKALRDARLARDGVVVIVIVALLLVVSGIGLFVAGL